MHTELFVNIQAAAAFLGVKMSWLYEQCRLSRVPSYKVGKYRRFRLSELEAWVKERQTGGGRSTQE
jgi:excisionase family DNA binding protein